MKIRDDIDKEIRNKNVTIQYLTKIDDSINCDVLFVSESYKDDLNDVLLYTKGKPILTIGDTEGFAKEGLIINFYLSEQKIRFEINEKNRLS